MEVLGTVGRCKESPDSGGGGTERRDELWRQAESELLSDSPDGLTGTSP